MLTTLLVSAGSKVLGAFGQSKKSSSSSSSNASSSGQTSSPASTSPSSGGGTHAPAPGMQMRSGTVMEKKMTTNGSETENIEIVDEG